MVAPAKRKIDLYQAFYTNCEYINKYMIDSLNITEGEQILEPCAGDGVFIDSMRHEFGANVHITAYELNEDSFGKAKRKYFGKSNISVFLKDTLLDEIPNKFDKIIANPPYGAWQSPEKRKILKKKYPRLYAKETYGLFLYRCVNLLKKSGRLVFIIPDTYLSLHIHENLRQFLISETKIESISLFPSKFFPDVNFGYAGLSIITIRKEKGSADHHFKIYSEYSEPDELPNTVLNEHKHLIAELNYSDIAKTKNFAFHVVKEKWVLDAIKSSNKCIGDICDVVTGFYSGNDSLYLRRFPHVKRGKNKYAEVRSEEICEEKLSPPPLMGLPKKRCWIPIVKGGNQRFYKPSEWFINWSEEAVFDYKVTNKKKARFQNAQFYFEQGVAVPMVSSTAITAALINHRLFDQSIVGIFHKSGIEEDSLYLLGFFNSKVSNSLIRTINSSTNNSSNYIKKIPFIEPTPSKKNAVINTTLTILDKSKKGFEFSNELTLLDSIFFEIYNAKA